jgi:hypothetical protein
VDALLAMLSRYSLLHFVDAAKSVVRLHRVMGMVLRHQHQHQQHLQHLQQQQPLNISAGVPVLNCPIFDIAWRHGMVAAVTGEYDQSSPVHGLRDLRLLPHLQSLKHWFDHSAAGSGWETSLSRADLLYSLAAPIVTVSTITGRRRSAPSGRWSSTRLSTAPVLCRSPTLASGWL